MDPNIATLALCAYNTEPEPRVQEVGGRHTRTRQQNRIDILQIRIGLRRDDIKARDLEDRRRVNLFLFVKFSNAAVEEGLEDANVPAVFGVAGFRRGVTFEDSDAEGRAGHCGGK